MIESWRWFGPGDVVPLAAIRQAGATGVVTSLHQIAYGAVWSVADIQERQALIGADSSLGLRWNVVESLPIHESVKLGEKNIAGVIDNYRASMRSIAACGIDAICYNFMPVIDWTRTDLAWTVAGGGNALRFDAARFAAFDCFMLARKGADADHHPDALRRGRAWFDASSESERDALLGAIMAGLPGAYDRYDIPALRQLLDRYAGTDAEELRARLLGFLRAVLPLAEELGLRFAIHPDDPPRPLMGLPRIVSCEADIAAILDGYVSPANGLTLCSGSLGANPANDVPQIARRFADRIHFAHLRNVAKEFDGSFYEADHLGGDTDMVELVTVLLEEEQRRKAQGRTDCAIPFRPDHGHELLDDIGKGSFPGYSAIGRLKGLAELRGVVAAVTQLRGWRTA